MRIAVCGGGLQGVEVCWLAEKAGWETVLLDNNGQAPARDLAGTFFEQDLMNLAQAPEAVRRAIHACELVVPATENPSALSALVAWCTANALPLAFDPAAYAVTSSKLHSRKLFARCGTPVATPCIAATEAVFPLIAKPAGGSGSRGVQVFQSMETFMSVFPLGFDTPHWLFEAYCPGPSYSVEVCGVPGAYQTFQVTGLLMDEAFDCCGVFAPSGLNAAQEQAIADEAVRLAEALSLRGLMDLEVILTPDGYRALEVDARFPSQTPTAVWLSSGVNLLEQLAACFIPYAAPSTAYLRPPVPAWYGHVLARDGVLRAQGEHVMAVHGPLVQAEDLLGADHVLYSEAAESQTSAPWSATLMFRGADISARREACLNHLAATCHLARGESA